MAKSIPDDRRLQIHAHFAWAAAFWGSARQAQERKNMLLSPIGYYYSAFHAGFAAASTNLDIPNESFIRIGHSQLKGYLDSILQPKTMIAFTYLQNIREGINYLGADSPEEKVQIVRGYPFSFDSKPYFECVENCRIHAVQVIDDAQQVIRNFGRTHSINVPDLKSDWWINDFLDDDVLLNVIPREEDGREILMRSYYEELPQLINET